MRIRSVPVALLIVTAFAWPAAAQRVTFERTFDTSAAVTLDVSTLGGRIELRTGSPGQVVVRGIATVRIGFNVPLNAPELAKQIAANPPIERTSDIIWLRPPSDDAQRRAATVAYDVLLPPGTVVRAKSDSGAIAATDLSAGTTLRTDSGRIDVMTAAGDLAVTTGSGAVSIDGAAAALTVMTSSSAIGIRGARGDVKVKTQSGAVTIDLAPTADIDVETGSSAIEVSGARKRLAARSQSGAIRVAGHTGGAWDVRTGSSRIELAVSRIGSASFALSSRSSDVEIPRDLVTSSVSKGHIVGTLGDGANRVTAQSGSGRIALYFN
jgi:DUF4097 and DUF4098 domain-containing protein YvlB